VPQLFVLGPVELVHHVSIPSESRVLRRSLEPVHQAERMREGEADAVAVAAPVSQGESGSHAAYDVKRL
ncbi:hypothetical protein, partial [Bifidobacterium merycicum]|uniref:hypothetical protein n=1 Tax=Bifidobacterium merycicum TaxID=78345 RepID=UPI0023F3AA74